MTIKTRTPGSQDVHQDETESREEAMIGVYDHGHIDVPAKYDDEERRR